MNLSKLKNLSKFSSKGNVLSLSKGFTLIELLIVIAILGILAAAVLVAINPGQRIAAARNSRVRADLSSIGSAANIFNTDSGLSATCVGGGSYPSAFGQTACGATFLAAPVPPTGAYSLERIPGACVPNSATPCTAISVEATAYSDGIVDASTNNIWCWRSATGTITQTTAAGCAP